MVGLFSGFYVLGLGFGFKVSGSMLSVLVWYYYFFGPESLLKISRKGEGPPSLINRNEKREMGISYKGVERFVGFG